VDNKNEIICQCFQVSEAKIRESIRAGNLTSIEQVTASCEAGGGCHSCHILLQLFLDQHQERTQPVSVGVSGVEPGFLRRLFLRTSKPPATAL
jgi:bacterioferritin-associated ferredoxin